MYTAQAVHRSLDMQMYTYIYIYICTYIITYICPSMYLSGYLSVHLSMKVVGPMAGPSCHEVHGCGEAPAAVLCTLGSLGRAGRREIGAPIKGGRVHWELIQGRFTAVALV